MLVGIIAENSYANVLHKALKFANQVDIFELRLDYILHHKPTELADCLLNISKPVIITIRGCREKGLYQGSEQERLDLIDHICELGPAYVDIEEYVPVDYIMQLHRAYPQLQIIKSYHDFDQMPVSELGAILQNMQDDCCHIYKIVGYAQSSIDCLVTLDFIKRSLDAKPSLKLTAHCMGKLGEPSRILGKMAGNYFTYVSLDDAELQSQLGIVDISAIHNIYNITKLNKDTKIYGLIGSPVDHSQGHLYHNANFANYNADAIYVKFDVKKEELKNFLAWVKQSSYLNFSGFSVTMPLKYEICKELDMPVDSGNCNTVKIIDNKLYGISTDGLGALMAINELTSSKELKNICLLGAGATATSIAIQAVKYNIHVTLLCRNMNKAATVLELLTPEQRSYLNILMQIDLLITKTTRMQFDVVINTLPLNVKNIELAGKDYLISDLVAQLSNDETLFMDVNYKNPILVANKPSLDGYNMFIKQAQLQANYWLKGQNNGN